MKQINRLGLYLILVAFFLLGCLGTGILHGEGGVFLVSLVFLTIGGFLLSVGD